MLSVRHQSWEAPLPPPAILEGYEHIIPGGAERILRMAEQEGEHSRRTQARGLVTLTTVTILGQVFALTVALSCLFVAYNLGMAGHTVPAAVIGGGTIATTVGAFMFKRKTGKKDQR